MVNKLFTPLPLLSPLPHLCSFTLPTAVLWVKPGDQAPATAPAEAAERGEEEQAADQHCCNSGSGGNESTGTAQSVQQQMALALFSCQV